MIREQKKIYSPSWELNGLFMFKPESPSSNDLCVKFEIGPAVLDKKIFEFSQWILVLSLSSPLRKSVGGFSFDKTRIPITQGSFVLGFIEIGQRFGPWEERLLMYFRHFVIIFTWRRACLQKDERTGGRTHAHTHDRRAEKISWAFSSDKLKTALLFASNYFPFESWHIDVGEIKIQQFLIHSRKIRAESRNPLIVKNIW